METEKLIKNIGKLRRLKIIVWEYFFHSFPDKIYINLGKSPIVGIIFLMFFFYYKDEFDS